MKTNEFDQKFWSGSSASGLTPLPQRFRRAQKWGARYQLGRFDIMALKQMLKAEHVGHG